MSQASTAVLDRARSSESAAPTLSALLTVAAVLALAHLPLLIMHGQSLWRREHCQLFPLVLIFGAILARPAYQAAITAPAGPSDRKRGVMLLALNWLLLTTAVVMDLPVLGAFAFWVLLIATAVASGGWPTLKPAIPALIYLLVIIPPPFNIDGKLVVFLQTYTSKAASRILDQIGVFHAMNGVVVEVGDKKYEVERACSGISSLLSVL